MAFDVVDENNVYTCVGHPLKSDISNMVDWMLNDTFSDAYDKVQKLKMLKGLSLQVILNGLGPSTEIKKRRKMSSNIAKTMEIPAKPLEQVK